MKNYLLFVSLFVSSFFFGQNKLARVENYSGLDVFVMNEPVADYKIVVRMKPLSLANLNVKTIVTGGIIRETVSDKMNQYVNQVLRQAEKENVEVDAIIYSGGKGAVGIQYTAKEDQGIARIKAINGMDVYVFCAPLVAYNVVKEKRAMSGYWVASASYGVFDSSMDRDIMKLVKRLNRRSGKTGINAAIYNGGRKGVGIVLAKE